MNILGIVTLLAALVATQAMYGYRKPRVQHRLIDEHHEVHTDQDYHPDPHGLGHYFDMGNIVSNHGFAYFYAGPHDFGHYANSGGGYGHSRGHSSGGYGHSSGGYGGGSSYQPPQVVVIKKIIPLSTTTAPTGK